jgi:hypothetical protein
VLRRGILVALALALACGKHERPAPAPSAQPAPPPRPTRPPRKPMPWDTGGPLAAGQTFVLTPQGNRRDTVEAARAAGLLDVDLGDDWAPFIFSESDTPGGERKPNAYRQTFITLANNRATPDELFLESDEGKRAVLAAAGVVRAKKGQPPSPEEKRAMTFARRSMAGERSRNYLEPFGIPPTLSVLRARVDEERGRTCREKLDLQGLKSFSASVAYLSREQARKDYDQANSDAVWAEKVRAATADAGAMPTATVTPPGAPLAAPTPAPPTPDPHDPKVIARLERTRRGQERLRAVRAVQALLQCEGLLGTRLKFTDGMFDLATNEALALWERKNDVFGWGFVGGETTEALLRPPMDLHFDTFKRILAERLAEAAGILEDGSVSKGKRPATYKDKDGTAHTVPDLVGDHVQALLNALAIETPDDMADFLARLGAEGTRTLHVAIPPPPLPPYYAPEMELKVEIDRGDIWYDFPWDKKGKPIVQRRERYPHLVLSTQWGKQRIPLVRWRTTIGSWRSEMHTDGKVYYKYKNSDVGPRIWKNIVAAPVWIPPEGTPGKDLLTKKVFDRNRGPVTVVNTDVMGPGFQSAYGLALAIHLKKQGGGGLFDNQIRTHGSVDYTSIARRFSHGCHRLVNNRAVRLFDFVLRHRPYQRIGNVPFSHFKRRFTVDTKEYEYELATRGYYYELDPPVPVDVLEGRIMGQVQKPITTYVRKPGVDYGDTEGGVEAAPAVGP